MTPPWETALKELGSGQTITPWTPPAPVVPARTAEHSPGGGGGHLRGLDFVEDMTRGAAHQLGEFAHYICITALSHLAPGATSILVLDKF